MTNRRIVLWLLHLLLGLYLRAQDTMLVVPTPDFVPDGYATQVSWQNADWLELPQRSHLDKKYTTRAKIMYSEKGLYYLFDCQDHKISATLQEDNANLWEEDVVEVFIWPDTQYPIYFEYELSPKNVELPILVPNLGGKFLGWLPWKYAGDRKVLHETSVQTQISDKGSEIVGWLAEFFIPFALLNPIVQEVPEPGDVWRGNFYRLDYDHEVVAAWSWQPVNINFHTFNKFGFLQFGEK